MAAAGLGATIGPVVVLLSAGVLAVPLFRRLGLGSVLGYLPPALWLVRRPSACSPTLPPCFTYRNSAWSCFCS